MQSAGPWNLADEFDKETSQRQLVSNRSGCGGLATMFCLTLTEFNRPCLVVRHLVTLVERVKQELPGLLAEWLRGIQG